MLYCLWFETHCWCDLLPLGQPTWRTRSWRQSVLDGAYFHRHNKGDKISPRIFFKKSTFFFHCLVSNQIPWFEGSITENAKTFLLEMSRISLLIKIAISCQFPFANAYISYVRKQIHYANLIYSFMKMAFPLEKLKIYPFL